MDATLWFKHATKSDNLIKCTLLVLQLQFVLLFEYMA